jgi:hypothetical protein
MSPSRDDPDAIVAKPRKGREITHLYAIVTRGEDGVEGIVRRDTPHGTQAWITEDESLVPVMFEHVRKTGQFPDAHLVVFTRNST